MKAPQHFIALRAACLPLIEGYHRDLLVHDRRLIRRHPKVPFIHVTRQYGSYLTLLHPAENYPPEGKEIPYIFSTADRWHLLKESGSIVAFCQKNHPDALVHYFDGQKLQVITYEKAASIIEEYIKGIKLTWARESQALADSRRLKFRQLLPLAAH